MSLEALLGGIRGDVAFILDQVLSRTRKITEEQAAVLLRARGREAQAVCLAADELRRQSVGDVVTYVVNRNINFTNVCVKRCGFCAFSRTGIDHEGYYLPTEEVVRRAKEAWDLGATEVCIQAGLPPNMSGDLYSSIARAVKEALPDIHLHAFSPEEVLYGSRRARVSIREYLIMLRDAGVDSIPGTSAEILVDGVRRVIARGRLSSAEWQSVVRTSHELGLRSTATMMYGHVEAPEDIARHLSIVRDMQSDTGGFTEFVPLSFVAREAPMYKEGRIAGMRGGPTGAEVQAVHAVSRIFLDGAIDNIQVSWVKEGLRMAQMLLSCGVNDLGGTLMNESISTAAGAGHGQLVKPSVLEDIICDAGRTPRERRTNYSRASASAVATATAAPHTRAKGEVGGEEKRVCVHGEEGEGRPVREDAEGERRKGVDAVNESSLGSYFQLIKDDRFSYARTKRKAGDSSSRGSRSFCTFPHRGTHPATATTIATTSTNASTTASSSRVTTAVSSAVVTTVACASSSSAAREDGESGHKCSARTRRQVTYSRSYTIVPTYECFNVCGYCNFRKGVGESLWMDVQEAKQRLHSLKRLRHPVTEILVMSGEVHPKSPRRSAWMDRVVALCAVAAEEGFFPHTNVGPVSYQEMSRLKAVNASMGLMLEQLKPLPNVHRFAPSKRPEVRLEQLRMAGELKIPFTTGILLGIGETQDDIAASLEAIAEVARVGGHIQEVIIQPHSPGDTQRTPGKPFDLEALPEVVALARDLLPDDVVVQVPPNLVHRPHVLLECLRNGASDLGGMSPKDEVNPSYAFPQVTLLDELLTTAGYELIERLATHERYFSWMPTQFEEAAVRWKRGPKDANVRVCVGGDGDGSGGGEGAAQHDRLEGEPARGGLHIAV